MTEWIQIPSLTGNADQRATVYAHLHAASGAAQRPDSNVCSTLLIPLTLFLQSKTSANDFEWTSGSLGVSHCLVPGIPPSSLRGTKQHNVGVKVWVFDGVKRKI